MAGGFVRSVCAAFSNERMLGENDVDDEKKEKKKKERGENGGRKRTERGGIK